jgi:tetratricopeptide (TPR) repeat protein
MNHIAHYLRDVSLNRKTGRLDLRFGEIRKSLFFQNGALVFARTNVASEKIGEIMFRLGFISPEVHSKIEQYIEPRQNIGRVLVGLGIIKEQDLQEALLVQMKEIALSLFSYFEAAVGFQEQERFIDQSLQSRVGIPFLIEEGIRRMRFHPELKAYMENRVPVFQARVHQHLLSEGEKKLLSHVNGTTTGAGLAPLSGMSPEDFWKSLYLFYALGMIDLLEEPMRAAGEPSAKASAEAGDLPPVTAPAESAVEAAGGTSGGSLQAMLREILSWKDRLENQNYYQFFRVAKDASEDEVKKAYFQLARKCHPDRFGRNLTPDIKAQVDDVFDQVTKAYRVLIDRGARLEYDQKLNAGPQEDAGNQAKRADIKFRQGKTLFNQGRYEEAVILLEQAVRLAGHKGDYYLLLGMAEAKIPTFSKKAEQDFLRAIELEPWNPEGLVALGMLYKQEGLTAKARRQFEKALAIDADHEIAQREMAPAGGEKKKGFFTFSVFGSGKKK